MNRVVQRLFIPEGIWYEFESGKKYLGNKYYMSFYKDEDYPVFCREGAIIPLSLDQTTNIHSVVVFGDKCKLKIKYPGNNEPVIHIKKLNKRIKKIINYGYISMSKTRINELYKTLKPYTQVSYFDKQKHIRQCMIRERSTL